MKTASFCLLNRSFSSWVNFTSPSSSFLLFLSMAFSTSKASLPLVGLGLSPLGDLPFRALPDSSSGCGFGLATTSSSSPEDISILSGLAAVATG